MMKIKGIDVSHWQGLIDWTKVAKDEVEFAFIKATEGTTYSKTAYFKENAAKAKKAGIAVGAYHYAKFGTVAEAKEEVAYFLAMVTGVELTYPLVLDLEENKKGASKKMLTDAAISFLEAVETAGYIPMLYSGKSFLETNLDESRLKKYALWVARYNNTLGRTADIWQYSDAGKVLGISGDVDLNWSYRDFSIKEIDTDVKTYSVPLWEGSPLKKGQIGRITILENINLWKRDGKELVKERILQPGETYRVYGYDEKHGGQYNVGGGFWITKMDGYNKYETPSKKTLEQAKEYYK